MGLIKGLLGELGSELVTEVLVPGLLLLVVLVLALPFYFILRRASGRKTTLREDLLETVIGQQPALGSPYVHELSSLRSGLETVGLYGIYAAIAVVTAFIIYFFATLRDDANKSFLQAIFGCGYLLFMLFAVGQALAIKNMRRQRRRKPVTPVMNVMNNIDKASGARIINFSFEFGLGGPPAQVKAQVDSVPEEDRLDSSAIETAQSHLDIGEGLETVCRSVNPRFADWSRSRQEAYKTYVQHALEGRSRGVVSRSPMQEPDPTPTAIAMPAEPPKSASGATGTFTPTQLVLIVMVFLAALATFLSVIMLSSRMRS